MADIVVTATVSSTQYAQLTLQNLKLLPWLCRWWTGLRHSMSQTWLSMTSWTDNSPWNSEENHFNSLHSWNGAIDFVLKCTSSPKVFSIRVGFWCKPTTLEFLIRFSDYFTGKGKPRTSGILIQSSQFKIYRYQFMGTQPFFG